MGVQAVDETCLSIGSRWVAGQSMKLVCLWDTDGGGWAVNETCLSMGYRWVVGQSM